MTAFSFTDWSSKTADEQKAAPGVSIERSHVVNNPNRGVYWSPETAAVALSRHIETTLAGDDEVASRRMWNSLRMLHRSATESPRMTDRAMDPRQADAHAALGSYNGELNWEQLEQLMSAYDDVARLQVEAQTLGIDPVDASRRMLDRAASRAIGYDLDDGQIEAGLRPLVESEAGSRIISSLNQSVGQLQLLMKGESLDALDHIDQIGRDTDYSDELKEDHRRLNDILGSIPLVLNPQEIEPEQNFSVRMETQQEATMMETVIRWAGQNERMPEPQEVHKAFASWRDDGMSESPYAERDLGLGIILGNTDTAREHAAELIGALDQNAESANAPIVVLTIDADQRMRDALAASGREIVEMRPEADANGVHLAHDGPLPEKRIELINVTREQAADSIERSIAVNAFVGRSEAVGFIAGDRMSPTEAQAIHIAGTLRKLNLGMSADGDRMSFNQLRDLRREARELDAENDPQRYYTAGNARPYQGINAVAFESANRYDAANRANASDRDVIADAYGSIPKDSTILTVANKDNALNKWLMQNSDRPILYAEATRELSFAEIVGVGLEGERRVAREAKMELKIYDVPPEAREYEFVRQNSRGGEVEKGAEGMEGVRRVCTTEAIEWDDPRIRRAAILVAGNASVGAINGSSQAIKVAQEAVMNFAHTALILTDETDRRASTDYHSAHMIRLAGEMGKHATVIDGNGAEVPLNVARDKTRAIAQNFTEKQISDLHEKMSVGAGGYGRNAPIDVAAKDDLGQLALAALPGMDAASAIRFGHTDVTLREIREDKSEDMRKHLLQLGMPAKTRSIVHDIEPWTKAMNNAINNMKAAEEIGATLHVPTDVSHPIEQASGGDSYRRAVFTVGDYDFEKQPIAAFIGNSQRYREAGAPLTLSEAEKAGVGAERGTMVDPADSVDRAMIRRSIEEMAAKGYGIGVTLEEGVSRAVLEEAIKVPEAKVVVMAPGNMAAASPELRVAVRALMEQDRAAVVMPTNIAAHPAPEAKAGEVRKPDTYSEDRNAMQDMLARSAKLGIVVALGDRDQSLHVVRHLVDLDKPIAAMIPQDTNAVGSDLYSGNMRLLRGAGKANIESVGLAQGTSAQAYAEIVDKETTVTLENGVRRGNAGTFQSARLGRGDMLRSGHSYHTFGWDKAAHPISSQASLERFVEGAQRGEGALGKYQEPTDREIERARLARENRAQQTRDAGFADFIREEFGGHSSLHRDAIEREAGRSVEAMSAMAAAGAGR